MNERERQLQAARDRRAALFIELDNVRARAQLEGDEGGGLAERLGNLNRGIARLDDEIRELEKDAALRELIREAAERGTVEAGVPPAEGLEHGPAGERNPVRDALLRAVERMQYLSPAAADRLAELAELDRAGLDSRYVAAVASPAYRSAFWKRVARPELAGQEFSAQEAEAVRAVAQVEAERALATGTGSAGGFAVPAALDPSILLTSDGAVNPIRQLATVTTIVSNVWHGVSSAGVTASFDAEAAEVSDDSPTLAQPSITPERATAFVPFSIELGQDLGALESEMARLFQDAKDVLEADKFVTGAGHGSTEPEGIVAGAGTAVIVTSASTTLAIGDPYAVQEALGARWQPRAQWLGNNATANKVYRLVGGGNTTEPPLFNEARDQLLGKPYREVSTMESVAATKKVLVYGDIGSAYRIVDRIGLQVELVAHLFGSSRRPTGQRGLLAIWRTSGGLINAAALRLLQMHS